MYLCDSVGNLLRDNAVDLSTQRHQETMGNNMEATCFKRSFWSRRLKNPGSSDNTDWYTNYYIVALYELSICFHIVQVQSQFPVQITITGRARLIQSHSSARFCFELSGNSN